MRWLVTPKYEGKPPGWAALVDTLLMIFYILIVFGGVYGLGHIIFG